jgi:VanZ family protein
MRPLPDNPVRMLFYTWPPRLNLFFLRDEVVNIALYVPLGLTAHFAFRGRVPRFFDLYGPVLLGLVLSTSVELTQLFEPQRNASVIDIMTNVAGTALGVFFGVVFDAVATPSVPAKTSQRPTDQSALALLFIGAAYFLFPFFPVLGLHGLIPKLTAFARAPVFDVTQLLSGLALWFAGGLLLKAANVRPARVWLAVWLLVLPLQFVIVGRQPVPSLMIGAAAGALLFAWRGRKARVRPAEAWIFLVVILVRGLWPFHFMAQLNVFSWIPFGGFLGDDWQAGIQVLLEKAFYYGTAVWLLRAAGMRLWQGAASVAIVLAFIEIVQIRLPGRIAETTDPLLALLLAAAMAILSRETETRSRSAG